MQNALNPRMTGGFAKALTPGKPGGGGDGDGGEGEKKKKEKKTRDVATNGAGVGSEDSQV